MSMTLYHYWRSSCSWRVRWALEIKGLAVNHIHVDLLSGESEQEPHLSRNPMGYVPALEVNGRMMVESMALIEWLDETIPAPALIPGDAHARAHIRALCETINSGTQPLQNLPALDMYSSDPGKRKEWSQFFIRKGLKAFETLVEKSAGKFCVGENITAADLFLIPQLYNAARNEINFRSEFPLLGRIHDEAMKTKEAQDSAPERYQPK